MRASPNQRYCSVNEVHPMLPDRVSAASHARRLLAELGRDDVKVAGDGDHPALAWRRSGLMDVCGPADGPGLQCPAALATAADGALLALKSLVDNPLALPMNGALLLGERARLMGLRRAGRISPNGSCRLLDAADGRIALSLPRPDDWGLLAALFECEDLSDWPSLTAELRQRPAREIVTRGIELGLAIALDEAPVPAARVFASRPLGAPRRGSPLVIDLAALWAGPLAASLLMMAGARVIKIETRSRPDAGRLGSAGFYDLLNERKQCVALNFDVPADRLILAHLIDAADIIIEGSRPRALRQLGIDRARVVANGATWVGITGHGGSGDAAGRIGFGDDAAVAAGLSTAMEQGWGAPLFAGDAIADPLTGLYAALGAWAGWGGGGKCLIDLSLRGTVAHSLNAGVANRDELLRWQSRAEADEQPYYPLRQALAPARPLGADTAAVLTSC
jgi:crotonobetainyl-CoA:carnitine CoA-transferase CaiB-like acyl-CoA transferase